MPEISPRITYSPQGVLTIRKTLDGDFTPAEFARQADILSQKPGYSVTDEGFDTVVSVDVDRVVPPTKGIDFLNTTSAHLINNVGHMAHFAPDDDRDGVFSADYWISNGASGVVHPHLQRWLNAGRLDEGSARRCIDAMAQPLGTEVRQAVQDDFFFHGDERGVVANAHGLGVITRTEGFTVTVDDTAGEPGAYRQGEVRWNTVELSTVGSCACWGVTGEQRQRVVLEPGSNRLYDMWPHNVDYAPQSLSLVLGAASLAYDAAQYPGREDVLADVQWQTEGR